ncbi:hypothetical protein C7C46_02860 [Streptomyces tateyamensis]|uniref:N-acetyltransferase domain-containing protein n=1 Tax=Streptomyces tateyamensis TaxID=565073 RepID=A0A2V4P9S0_9ACTN|nr:hypothetical protein [Streptomyces tateyamensis]PYC87706.1 hypothetical protein C7C46_02860 [Streptomyces tateyamensis]
MPVTVRRAVAEDLHQVYPLLRDSTLNSSWIPFESRRRMFQPQWGGNEGYYGYVMEDGSEVVGFLGTLFTERDIDGRRHKFCEIHSWFVKDAYRNESMKLFLPVMSIRKATLLNYTPTRTVYDISKKFGWADLETKVLQFLPVPTPRTLSPGYRLETRKHLIIQHLDEADRKIFLDHENLDCRHYLVMRRGSTDYLYLVVKKLRLRKYVPFGRILYASNKPMLLDVIDRLRLDLCLRLGAAFVVIDHAELADLLDQRGAPAFAKVVTREVPSQYKSKDLTAQDIGPALYSLPLLIGYRLH